MYSAASGWLMTSLSPDPLIVALVQAASSLPICLFAIPAGALADIFDKRRFLIVVETITTVVSAVGLGWATPANLLVFTFLIGAAGAMTVPAWQAVVTYLVPKDDLPPAIAVNSVGVNISRAIGPALGGLTISAYGIGSAPLRPIRQSKGDAFHRRRDLIDTIAIGIASISGPSQPATFRVAVAA